MTTAAASTVSEIEVFRHQAGMVQTVVRVNVDGLSQEESLIQPSPGGNCLNWVVGHLACIYNKVLPMVGQEPVMDAGALKRYDRGAPPIRDAAEALELRDLLAAFDKATERVVAGLASLSPEALDQKVPESPSGNPNETVRSLLSTIFFHQAYHAGQTGILRRIAGKEGAIR
ncbi:MAG TPA: DinB family protein [Thermoanaerobaculia bacterium]|nr:DinB family protein [Thermoanaerobaculia bacterium]